MAVLEVDLLILGSGSTAFAAALRAQESGKTSLMIEERTIGGTCVNRGCLPSKNLIEAARLVHDARHPRYPGLSPGEKGALSSESVVSAQTISNLCGDAIFLRGFLTSSSQRTHPRREAPGHLLSGDNATTKAEVSELID